MAGSFISLVSVVLVLGATEVTLRLVIPPLPLTTGSIYQPSTNPRLVYEHKPGSEGVYLGVPVQINSMGLRDVEYSRDKPSGIFRIVAIGDSFTFGAGVSLEDTYVKQLEKGLNALGPQEFQVINAGINGSNIVRNIEMLKTRDLLNYDPDLVLVGYNIHNVELGHEYTSPTASGSPRADIEIRDAGPKYGPIPKIG